MAYIDLHLHLDGSLSVESTKELLTITKSDELKRDYTEKSDEELKRALSVGESCQDLNEYLARFALPLALLQSEEALELATHRLCMELKEQDYIYAELRFAPAQHTRMGCSQEAIIEAALSGIDAAKRDGFSAHLILCCMRTDDTDIARANAKTIELAAKYRDQGVCAVDLAGAEALFATKNFEKLFLRAKELELPYTIHAGEADGADSVRAALAMGALRIGHGQTSTEDNELLQKLAEDQICLEVCPTSNINTRLYHNYSEVPLATFDSYGIPYCICSDNMAVSNTNVPTELSRLATAFGWDELQQKEQLKHSNLTALKAAFISENEREELLRKL